MKIIVAGTPQARSEEIAALLSGAEGESLEIESLGTEFNAEDLTRRLQGEDDIGAVLLYALPENAAEEAIANNADVDEALSAWRTAAEGILSVRESTESRTVVVHGPNAVQLPGPFVSIASEHLGTHLQSSEALASGRTAEGSETANPLARVLAAARTAGAEDLTQLSRQLQAASRSLSQETPTYAADWQAAYGDYRDLRQVREQKDPQAEHVRELEEENELILRQLHQVQEELERYYLEAEQLRERGSVSSSAEVDALLSYARQLEHEYTKLLRSRTWKALAPVRETSRLVKSTLRGRRVPRNRLPERPGLLEDAPIGTVSGKASPRVIELEGKVATAERELEQAKAEREREKEARAAAERELEQAKAEREREKEARAAVEKESEEQLSNVIKERDQLIEKSKGTESKLSSLQEELNASRREKDEVDSSVSEQASRISELQERVKHLQQENSEYQSRQAVMHEEMRRAEGQIDLVKELLLRERST